MSNAPLCAYVCTCMLITIITLHEHFSNVYRNKIHKQNKMNKSDLSI